MGSSRKGFKELLRAENLRHSFTEGSQKTEVLKGVSLQVCAGETTAVVGPSGCGKSTLLYLLGLLDRPESGKIYLNNSEVSGSSDHERTSLRNTSIGFIFQFHFLIKELTAIENVALPLRKSGICEKEAQERSLAILEKLGLGSKSQRFANKLSGGEQQRVAIARAMVNSPTLILADEPTGNLDTENSENVFEVIQELAESENLGVLIVTHNSELALKTNKLIRMKDGLIIKDE
ncbi:MAG: ABC transporter ATP-binding protein [Verrucomicrobiota bacterium]|nr:ABC transporter ATP-binding protein [Verrucomicrobiota bacterium]